MPCYDYSTFTQSTNIREYQTTRRLISPIKQSHTRIVRGRPSSRKHGRRSTSTRVEGEEHASHEIAEAPEASNAL